MNRIEQNKGWLGTLVEEVAEADQTKTPEDPTESSESQDNSTALIQNATKASEQGKKTSLIWKNEWTYS